MSALPDTLPRIIDLPCVVEQLHRTGRNAESAEFAFALARDVRRRSPWTVLRYYARLHEIGAAEIANLCTMDFARALLADRAAVVAELERQGRDLWERANEGQVPVDYAGDLAIARWEQRMEVAL